MPTNPNVQLYQIAYDSDTYAGVEPGYGTLDNTDNPRPDWYEYWPIRKFLIDTELSEDCYYGFFSTKFKQKTQLSYSDVVSFINLRSANADVIIFSPQPDMGAFFLNVFEQAELFDPGLIEAYGRFLEATGRSLPFQSLVMDSSNIVFSNFFVAKPAFWREWLALNESLFAICEGVDSDLKTALTKPTTYPGAAQRKVFLQERAASLLLATQPRWKSVAYNPFGMGWSSSRFRDYPSHAYISDALKLAYRSHAYPQYIEAFAHVRDTFQKSVSPANDTVLSPRLLKPVRNANNAANKTLHGYLKSKIPVIVPTYNNPTYAESMVSQLKELDINEILIVDNCSTSEDMIELLDHMDSQVDVIRLPENKGPHHVFLDQNVFNLLPQIFCVTDPDIKFNDAMPKDFMAVLLGLTEKYSIGKAGLALDISDREVLRVDKATHGGKQFHIWEWEAQFWSNHVDALADGSPIYLADIDTTFSLYNKKFFTTALFYRALRVAGNYTSFHLPWYKDNGMKPKEDAQYRATQKYSYYVQ